MANYLKALFGASDKKAMTLRQGGNFRYIGGQLVPYDGKADTYIKKAYMYNAMIYSVVKIILDKATQPPFRIYQIEDEQKFFEYSGMVQKFSKGAALPTAEEWSRFSRLRKKAIKPITNDGYLKELAEYPNEDEHRSELDYARWGYKLITGNTYTAGWDVFSGGLNGGKPMGEYILPAQYMDIISEQGEFPGKLRASGYMLRLGVNMGFDRSDVLHEKYWNPDWDVYGTQLYGMSPIKASINEIQTDNEAVIRQGKMMKNAGADVIVYLDDPNLIGQGDFSIEQIGEMKKKHVSEQFGSDNAGTAVWSPYKMGAARLGLTAVEMDILDSRKASHRTFANTYGVPSQLLNDDANKSYNNQLEGEKALTMRCAIPLNVATQRAWNRKLQQCPAYKGKPVVGEYDLTAYSELEANKKDLVEWMNKTYFTIEKQYEYLNEEVPEWMSEEQRRSIPIPSGIQLFNDLFTDTQDLSEQNEQLNRDGLNPYNDNE